MVNEDKINENSYLFCIGTAIKKIRLQKKISQTEIAYRCGFDKSNFNTIEAGKRNPTILSLYNIAKALDCDVTDFFQF